MVQVTRHFWTKVMCYFTVSLCLFFSLPFLLSPWLHTCVYIGGRRYVGTCFFPSFANFPSPRGRRERSHRQKAPSKVCSAIGSCACGPAAPRFFCLLLSRKPHGGWLRRLQAPPRVILPSDYQDGVRLAYLRPCDVLDVGCCAFPPPEKPKGRRVSVHWMRRESSLERQIVSHHVGGLQRSSVSVPVLVHVLQRFLHLFLCRLKPVRAHQPVVLRFRCRIVSVVSTTRGKSLAYSLAQPIGSPGLRSSSESSFRQSRSASPIYTLLACNSSPPPRRP